MNAYTLPLLRIQDLKTSFFTVSGTVKAVNGIDLRIDPGETLGLVGESGCGKSVTALSIMRLVPSPGEIISGSIHLEEKELLGLSETEMRGIRGGSISMIFQEPLTSLNPVFTIGEQIIEAVMLHRKVSGKEAQGRMLELLEEVNIPSPAQSSGCYPHQLSGGMRQRVMIAMALSGEPKLLIADEPTTALDVTISAQILSLLKKLQKKFGMSILFITHDFGILSQIADTIAVMYAGEIVESAPISRLFKRQYHPYSRGLIGCLNYFGKKGARLKTIPGNVPDLARLPEGCAFRERCEYSGERCADSRPSLAEAEAGHSVACYNWR